jgi:hypothetical protein
MMAGTGPLRTLCGGDVWALPSEDIGHIGEYIDRGKRTSQDDALKRR